MMDPLKSLGRFVMSTPTISSISALIKEQKDVGDQSNSKTAPNLLRNHTDLLPKSGQLQTAAEIDNCDTAVVEPGTIFEDRI
jgi:hypothetical protein